MTYEQFIALLGGKCVSQGSVRAVCPAHESRNKSKSLAVKRGANGGILVRCWAGCSLDEIVGAMGLTVADLMPDRPLGHRVPQHYKPVRGEAWTVNKCDERAAVEEYCRAIRHEARMAINGFEVDGYALEDAADRISHLVKLLVVGYTSRSS